MGRAKNETANQGLISKMNGLLTKVKNKAQAGINQVEATLEDRNEVFRTVMALRDRTQTVLDANRSDLYHSGQEKVIKAAESFITDLTALLDSQTKVYQNVALGHQLLLADNCLDIIFEHQARLEAAPGFWNQLKALFNDCVEYLFNVKNTLKTEGTVFREDEPSQEYKGKIITMQDELETEIEQVRNSPSPGR
ncbi:MAG: hypothetical protein ACRC0B_07755 [Legionella sp.]